MSRESPFQRVERYCRDQRKSIAVRNIAYATFQQQFEEFVEDKIRGHNPPDEAQLETIRETLLSDKSIASHVRLAEEILSDATREAFKPFQRRENIKTFWLSAATGIVANVIYSILLIIVFVIAREQIATWLWSVTKTP